MLKMGWWLLERAAGLTEWKKRMAKGVFGSSNGICLRVNTNTSISAHASIFFFAKWIIICWICRKCNGLIWNGLWCNHIIIYTGMILAKMRWNFQIQRMEYYFDCFLKSIHLSLSFDRMKNSETQKNEYYWRQIAF